MALLNIGHEIDRHGLTVYGVVHLGGHLGEEALEYASRIGDRVIWIEANPEVLPKLRAEAGQFGQHVVHALVLDDERDVTFNVTNYDGMSSSVIPWGTHPQFSPDTVITHQLRLRSTTLDQLVAEHPTLPWEACNLLNADIEGAGLWALKGGTEFLKQIDHLYLEIQTDNVYDGAPRLDEVEEWLGERGYRRLALGMVEGQGWGDGLWTRQ